MNPLSNIYYSLLSFLGAIPTSDAVNTLPIKPFDLNRYLGTWYEIARYNHSFERGLTHVTANYSLKTNGEVRVENSGLINGRRKKAIGRAKFMDKVACGAVRKGELKVSFYANFFAPYKIIMLDDDYSYALVTSGRRYLWVLSRTPQLPSDVMSKIYSEASRRHFNLGKLILVDQS